MKKKTVQGFVVLLLCMFIVLPVLVQSQNFKNAKRIEKSVTEISPKLFVAKTEVSNMEYQEFLSDLVSQNRTDVYKKCLPDSTAWEILSDTISVCFEYFYNYHSSLSYKYYPAVSISYEAASLFCKWLTEKYNSSTKRNYKKVEIKLPDETQWIQAAGGYNSSPFAWGDELLYDSKGGAKARLRFIDKSNFFIRDFPAIAAPVKSFIKYKYGLYNLHGNVAEMLDIKGKAKGGSWYDTPENAVLSQTQTFNGPDPRIGFRYFMVVIEE